MSGSPRSTTNLLVIITLITVFVVALLIYVMVRFHTPRNPVPTRTTHNTVIEIAVDGRAGADPGRHRDPVLQADVFHGPGAAMRR